MKGLSSCKLHWGGPLISYNCNWLDSKDQMCVCVCAVCLLQVSLVLFQFVTNRHKSPAFYCIQLMQVYHAHIDHRGLNLPCPPSPSRNTCQALSNHKKHKKNNLSNLSPFLPETAETLVFSGSQRRSLSQYQASQRWLLDLLKLVRLAVDASEIMQLAWLSSWGVYMELVNIPSFYYGIYNHIYN